MSVVGAAPAAALEGPGATGAGYLALANGPVSIAMGETGAAIEGDPFNWIVNPALLGQTKSFGLGVSHAEWILDTRFEHAALRARLGRAFRRRREPRLPVRSRHAGIRRRRAPDGAAQEQQLSGGPRLRRDPLPGLSAGVTAKYFRETLADWSAGGAAADMGVFYAWPAPHIAIGASVQNLGADVSFDGVEEPLPTTIRGARASPLRSFRRSGRGSDRRRSRETPLREPLHERGHRAHHFGHALDTRRLVRPRIPRGRRSHPRGRREDPRACADRLRLHAGTAISATFPPDRGAFLAAVIRARARRGDTGRGAQADRSSEAPSFGFSAPSSISGFPFS